MTLFWIGSAAALVAAALVVVLAPARWRGRAMLGWLVVPAPVYVVLILVEVLTRPGQENVLQNALLGFSLISAVLIIPWLVVCGLGFGLGFLLLRRLRGPEAPLASPTAPPKFTPPPQPPPVERDGWRSVHVGVSNDGLTIGGHDVWTAPWRDIGAAPRLLPHPAHPGQIHDFRIYEMGEHDPVRFAAAELSNGVWGFYAQSADAPVACVPPPSGGDIDRRDSPFGDLRVEFEAREWANTRWVFAPRVVEIDGGQVLLDLHGTDWDATAVFPAPGRVSLDLRRYRGGATVQAIIDVPAMRYELTPAPGADPITGHLSEFRGALERLQGGGA